MPAFLWAQFFKNNMAILWSKKTAGVTYEVRTAGKSLRLYTDGVFHSQYNPNNPVTGSVWDLLFIPAYFYAKDKVKRILLLGVGGGAVIRQLLQFYNPDEIAGVELNAVHLSLAKRFFGLRNKKISLHHQDAVEWVHNYQGPAFDLIIDDLFGECNGDPVRAVAMDKQWFKALDACLSASGALVTNFVSPQEMKQCAYFKEPAIRKKFHTAFRLTTPVTENAVGVFLKTNAASGLLRHNLKQEPLLRRAIQNNKLRYNIRQVTV